MCTNALNHCQPKVACADEHGRVMQTTWSVLFLMSNSCLGQPHGIKLVLIIVVLHGCGIVVSDVVLYSSESHLINHPLMYRPFNIDLKQTRWYQP